MINVASVDPFPDHFHCTVETGRVFTYIIIPKKRHCSTCFGKYAYLLVFKELDENIDSALMLLSPELVWLAE